MGQVVNPGINLEPSGLSAASEPLVLIWTEGSYIILPSSGVFHIAVDVATGVFNKLYVQLHELYPGACPTQLLVILTSCWDTNSSVHSGLVAIRCSSLNKNLKAGAELLFRSDFSKYKIYIFLFFLWSLELNLISKSATGKGRNRI